MLTFFRRLRKGFLDGGRTSKYLLYAIGEIALVVIGILIALAINDNYDRMQNAKKEKEYIQSILQDVRKTKNQFTVAESKNSKSIRSVINLIGAFSNSEIQQSDSINFWLGNARVIDNPVPIMNTMDILVSTGDLNLIKSSILKTEITEWMSYVNDYWLLPLYDLEQEHRELYRKLITEVDQFQLDIPLNTKADSLFYIQPPSVSPFPVSTDEYFKSQANYARLSAFYKLKLIMADYRNAMVEGAERIEEIILSLI